MDVIKLLAALFTDVDLDPVSCDYIVRRFRSEGIQFLTCTLPKLEKAVLYSLELGYFDRPTCFAWKGRSLRFFRSLLVGIFDSNGKVLPNVDSVSLWRLRQLCSYFYKLSLPSSEEALEKAEEKFIINDNSLSGGCDRAFVDRLRKDVETYFPFTRATVQDIYRDFRPRLGSGTFAGKNVYKKRSGKDWYMLKSSFPIYSKADTPYLGFFKAYPSAPKPICEPVYSTSSEVLFVPKDSRGPRTIVREPAHVTAVCMSYHDFLTSMLEKHTKNRVNFRDQAINRVLAKEGSKSKEWVTLDLKDASDLVDNKIVRHIFRSCPGMRYFLNKRSNYALLPSGSYHKLNKLAGMGSGLTFPTMSFLIYLSIVRSITDYNRDSYWNNSKLVYVYGDDIIVPKKYAHIAIESLKRIKLVVNTSKSFINSHFRESCGGDYYDGMDVGTVKLRLSGTDLIFANGKLSVEGNLSFVQLVAHANELRRNGMISTSSYFYNYIEKRFGKLPLVSGDSPVLGRHVHYVEYPTDETGAYALVKATIPVPTLSKYIFDPYIRLSSHFRRDRLSELSHLQNENIGSNYVPVPRSITYKRKKISAFRLMG